MFVVGQTFLFISIVLGHHLTMAALWNFCNIIECSTGRNCLDYNSYGCWCGWGGSKPPVDNIDKCCKEHDLCYRRVRLRFFCLFGKFDHYTVDCVSAGGKKNKALCSYKNGRCEKLMCECDSTAASCFAKHSYPDKKPGCPKRKIFGFSLPDIKLPKFPNIKFPISL